MCGGEKKTEVLISTVQCTQLLSWHMELVSIVSLTDTCLWFTIIEEGFI